MKLTFVVPPGERVFLRSEFNKDPKYTVHEKKVEDVKIDPQIESNPTITASNAQEMKDAQDSPEVTKPSSTDGKMKEATGTGLLDVSASSKNDTTLDPETKSQQVPTSNDKEMQADTETEDYSVPAAYIDQRTQHESTGFSVIVVSPTKGQKAEHTIPAPEPQPIVTRKRGRPRKNPLPELVPNAEDSAQPVSMNGDQPTTASKKGRPRKQLQPVPVSKAAVRAGSEHPVTPLSIPAEEIVKNGRAGAGVSLPEFANPELHSRQFPPPCPEISEDNQKPQTTSIGVSAKPPGMTDNDGSNIPTEETSEVDQDEDSTSRITKQRKTEELASSQDTNNMITNEMGEIILPNISTPHSLVIKILQIDGRKPNGRTANAWKEFRCYRNNQDMGSLFDVRETWFLQHE